MTTSTTSIDIMGLQASYANLDTDQERDYCMQRYHDVISSFGGKTSYDADNRPLLVMRSNLWASGYDVDGTDQTSLFFSSRRLHTRLQDDWSSDVCSSDLLRACMQVYARIVTMDFGMCLIRVGDEQVPPDSRRELRRQKAAIDQAFRRLVAAGVQEGSLDRKSVV